MKVEKYMEEDRTKLVKKKKKNNYKTRKDKKLRTKVYLTTAGCR